MTRIFPNETKIKSRGHFDQAWWLICKTYSSGAHNSAFIHGAGADTMVWWIEKCTKVRMHPKLFKRVCIFARENGMCVYVKRTDQGYFGNRMLIPKYLRPNLLVCRVKYPKIATQAEIEFIERILEDYPHF